MNWFTLTLAAAKDSSTPLGKWLRYISCGAVGLLVGLIF